MKEEIGVELSTEFLGKYLFNYKSENEYSAIFKAFSDGPFSLEPKEAEDGRFFNLAEIKTVMWDKLALAAQKVLNKTVFSQDNL